MAPEEMWNQSGLQGTYESWAFSGASDELAELVVKGIKTATCSALAIYEVENESLPEVGNYSVILDSRGDAVCIIKTTRVSVVPFCKVSAEHAYKEGEGDRSLDYWRRAHMEFFSKELGAIGYGFDETVKVVCEEFQVVYVMNAKVVAEKSS